MYEHSLCIAMELAEGCDQDTFLLNVLTIFCIYQFPEILQGSKIFVSASCCFIVYEKSN